MAYQLRTNKSVAIKNICAIAWKLNRGWSRLWLSNFVLSCSQSPKFFLRYLLSQDTCPAAVDQFSRLTRTDRAIPNSLHSLFFWSGTTPAGERYINLKPAIHRGGLSCNSWSEPVIVEFDNPGRLLIDLKPKRHA